MRMCRKQELRLKRPHLRLQPQRPSRNLKNKTRARRFSPLVKIIEQYQLIGERSLNQRETAGLRIFVKSGSQKSEVRSQKSEVRSQKSEVRSQKSEVRSQKS